MDFMLKKFKSRKFKSKLTDKEIISHEKRKDYLIKGASTLISDKYINNTAHFDGDN